MDAARTLLRALLLTAALAGCQPADAPAGDRASLIAPSTAGRGSFDYWLLALSWSPEYCASSEARPGSRQCAQPREFVVHGLWPQYERGYPEFCDTQTRVSERTADRLAPLVPDRGLVFHQWKKHGSCSGLDVDAYFAQLERAARAVRIPSQALAQAGSERTSRAELEREFLALNPGLDADAIVFQCRSGYLREVRVCFDRALRPRACGPDVREGCGQALNVRPTSGDR